MIIKLKDLRNEFYTYTTKTGEISRQLSLAGIAIVWLFKKENIAINDYILNLSDDLVRILRFFLIAVSMDFLHAFVPSLMFGIKVESEDIVKADDEKDLALSFFWALIPWIFYTGKVICMIIGYVLLLIYIKV